MNTITLTIVGNLTDKPEVKYLNSGVAVTRFNVAHNPRVRKSDGTWTDGEPTFFTVNAWRDLAESCAVSLAKGNRVIVYGTVRTERWDDEKTGDKKSRMVIDASAVGAELSFATATVHKMNRRNDAPPDDEWATATPERPETTTNA